MKLDYDILWVDDSVKWKEDVFEEVSKHIISKGFNPRIADASTPKEFENKINKNYDMIVVDLDLNDKAKDGKSLIEKVREKKIYTNIVFYSSEEEKLFKLLYENKIQGVYVFSREQLGLKNISKHLLKLIDFFLERDMDLSSMRGIAMSEVAEFDSVIWEIIEPHNCKSEIASIVREQKKSKYEEFQNKNDNKIWKDIKKDGTIVFDSFTRQKFLCENILEEKCNCTSPNVQLKQCYDKLNGEYHENVLKIRNKLAHKIEDLLSEKEKIKFRNDLIDFRKTLQDVKGIL